jgi:hypothetical protein
MLPVVPVYAGSAGFLCWICWLTGNASYARWKTTLAKLAGDAYYNSCLLMMAVLYMLSMLAGYTGVCYWLVLLAG